MGGNTLTKSFSNFGGVLSTRNRKRSPTNCNVKVWVVQVESSHVLGLKKNYQFDTIVVSQGTSPDRNCTLTERVVLGHVLAVYDPIGLITSYTVKARQLLTDIWWLSGKHWNDNLRDHLADKYFKRSDKLAK